jgi:prepilin-type N-terminal cleavage/methylation domain-containing protein
LLNKPKTNQQGFTIAELSVVLVVAAVVVIVAYGFYDTAITKYLALQADGISASDLALQTQRIASILRGATDIITASTTEMTINSYFSPNDAYVSQVRYYKSVNGKQLLADVTPYTSNPPIGTLDTSKAKTYIIISDFYTKTGVSTFEYIDGNGGTMALPINDLHSIKGLRVNLVSKPSGANNSLSVQVSLRNRKNNL